MGMAVSEDPYRPEDAFVPPIATSRVAKAAWDSGFEDREVNIAAKMIARTDLSKIGDKLSPEKLNAQFKGLNADREMTAQEAQFTHELKEEKTQRDAIVGNASGFWQGSALPFVVGAASSMADPVGFAVGAFTGWGLGKVASKAITKTAVKSGALKLSALQMNAFAKSTTGKALSAAEKKIVSEITSKTALTGAKKFALDAVDNTIGNSIAEGLVWKDRKETFEEYTTKDFLQNAIGGAVLMTGAIHGGSKIMKSAAKAGDKYLNNTQKVVDTLVDNGKSTEAVNEMLTVMDKAISHTDESHAIIKEAFGETVEAGESLMDTAKNIREAYAEGKINDTDVETYNSRIEDSSVVDNRAVDMIDPDYTFSHTDKELGIFNTKMDSKTSDVGYNKVVEDRSDSLNDYDPKQAELELDEEVEAIFNTKEADADGVEIELDAETTAIKNKMGDELEVTKLQETYAKCRIL